MKIQEIGSLNLDETTFKLSERSMTARVNNKTKAIINDIQAVKSLPFNRKVDLNVRFNGKLNKYFDSLYLSNDNNLFYFIDQKYHKQVSEMFNNGWTDAAEKLFTTINELSALNVNVLYLDIA